jgi:hypothetical protein
MRLARQECDAMVSIFASKCAVSKADVSRTSDPNIYKVILELLYVSKAPFGVVAKEGEHSLISSKINLSRNGSQSTRVDRRGHKHVRRDFYRAAMVECENLRARLGNCALHDLQIIGAYSFDDQMINATATVKTVSIRTQNK